MIDTQRFAIWHPPAADPVPAKKPAPVATPQQPAGRYSRNIGQIIQDYSWRDSARESVPSTSPPKTSPTNQAHPSAQWSYNKPTAAPPPPRRFSATVEDVEDEDSTDESSSSDEEDVPVVSSAPVNPLWQKSIKPNPLPAPIPTAPPVTDNRVKLQERLQFQKPKESPRQQLEHKPVQFPPPSNTFKVSTIVDDAKAAKQKMASGISLSKQVPPQPEPKPKSADPSTTGFSQPQPQSKVTTGWRLRSDSNAPKPSPPKAAEQPRKVSASFQPPPQAQAPLPVPQHSTTPKPPPPRRESHDHEDMGYLAYNSVVTLNAFLMELQDSAYDGFKMSMMEASIRQFHLIAADADIQLTRELISMKAHANIDTRSRLIEKHRSLLEEQAHSVLDGMHAFHSQVRENCWKATREDRGWEEPFVGSAPKEVIKPVVAQERIVVKAPEPVPVWGMPERTAGAPEPVPVWGMPESAASRAAERVPEWGMPERAASRATERVPEWGMPERAAERISEKLPTPERIVERAPDKPPPDQVPAQFWRPTFVDDSAPSTPRLAIDEVFERVQADLERENRSSYAPPVPTPAHAHVPARSNALPMQHARRPSLISPSQSTFMQHKVDSLPSKPPTKPTDKPAEKRTDTPVLTKSATNITKASAATKPKTPKELRAEKKKGKNKLETGPQQQAEQPSDHLETMIDKMVSSGNAEGALEHMAGAWR